MDHHIKEDTIICKLFTKRLNLLIQQLLGRFEVQYLSVRFDVVFLGLDKVKFVICLLRVVRPCVELLIRDCIYM